MRPTFWQRLDAFARHQVPVVVTLVLMLVSVIPSHTAGLAQIGPMLSLISVYYWAVYRPDLLGYGAVFAIGLLEDTIGGTPLGVGSLMLLLVHAVVVTQYKFFHGKSFTVTWWAFVVVAAFASVVRWLCISALQGTFVSPQAPLYAYLMTVALYPVIGWLLVRLHYHLLRDV
jgi:rod shape-determining protein MreD